MSVPCQQPAAPLQQSTAPPAATVPPLPPGPAAPLPPAPAAPRPAVDWRIRFAALSLIWGFSFLLIKVGTEGYAPFQVTLGRLLAGTAVLAVAMAMRRERLPRSARTWGHITVAAFFLNALPFSLFSYAELTIPSTLAGICNATSPLWGMALSVVALSEDRPTRSPRRGAGRRLPRRADGAGCLAGLLRAWTLRGNFRWRCCPLFSYAVLAQIYSLHVLQ
ncbi:hypothetical protein SMICM304S_11950 [Streptomyces microflavus]